MPKESYKYETEHLIDVTSMYRILTEFVLHDLIKVIIDVKDCNLAEIADLCIVREGFDSEESMKQLKEKFDSGEVLMFQNSIENVIPTDNAVHCIRIEPIYLVKDLNKIYE